MMKTAVKPHFKSSTFCSRKSYTRLRAQDNALVSVKFYQKLFIVFISLSTILIFPETPKEIERICESYYSEELCNVL